MSPRTWFPESLTGDRVVLRRHAPANLRAFHRWYADPEVVRLTRYQDSPMQPDEIERFFAARALGSDSLAMAIHLRDSDRLVGTCALSQLDADMARRSSTSRSARRTHGATGSAPRRPG